MECERYVEYLACSSAISVFVMTTEERFQTAGQNTVTRVATVYSLSPRSPHSVRDAIQQQF